MDESLELDLDLGEDENINNRSQERIKNLSSKVKEAAGERDAAKAAAEAAETGRLDAEKKLSFLESFSDVSTKHPGATEYREAIQEKVLSGYTVEDATVAVLAAEGKYTPPAVEVPAENVAGGSAPIQLTGENKTVAEMSQEERRAQLVEADKRGEISQILQRGL